MIIIRFIARLFLDGIVVISSTCLLLSSNVRSKSTTVLVDRVFMVVFVLFSTMNIFVEGDTLNVEVAMKKAKFGESG